MKQGHIETIVITLMADNVQLFYLTLFKLGGGQ